MNYRSTKYPTNGWPQWPVWFVPFLTTQYGCNIDSRFEWSWTEDVPF